MSDMTNNFFMMQDLDTEILSDIVDMICAVSRDNAIVAKLLQRIGTTAEVFTLADSKLRDQPGRPPHYNWLPVMITRMDGVRVEGFKVAVEDVTGRMEVEFFFTAGDFKHAAEYFDRVDVYGWNNRVPLTVAGA